METTIYFCRKVYEGLIKDLSLNQIFVYGANPEFRHGAGAAKIARDKYGAVNGEGPFCGRSYGLITKNLTENYLSPTGKFYDKSGPRSISKEEIIANIKELYEFAKNWDELDFLVAYTKNGSNLNGYSAKEMAEMFSSTGMSIPHNIVFEKEFTNLIIESII